MFLLTASCVFFFVLLNVLFLSLLVLRLSHMLQQTHQLRGCSFCWGQRTATRSTSPTPCSPSWTKSASGRARMPNGKRQPGTTLQSATWAGTGQLWLLSYVCTYDCVAASFICTLHVLYCKLQLISGPYQTRRWGSSRHKHKNDDVCVLIDLFQCLQVAEVRRGRWGWWGTVE